MGGGQAGRAGAAGKVGSTKRQCQDATKPHLALPQGRALTSAEYVNTS